MAATMSSKGGTVKAAHSSKYGSLLVSATGWTLYHYTPDKHGAIKCTAACAKFWPPLVVARGVKPKAGAGVSCGEALDREAARRATQVTYAGFPLYRYSGDTKPGDVKGAGIPGRLACRHPCRHAREGLGRDGHRTTQPGTTTDSSGGYGY